MEGTVSEVKKRSIWNVMYNTWEEHLWHLDLSPGG